MKKNKLKKISSRICGGGILLLSNLSLVSIGFSAWTIGSVTSAEAEIKVSVDDVIDLNQYFTFVDSPTIFEYTSEGIVNNYVVDTSSSTQEGYIKIPFRIDVKTGKIRNHLQEGSTGFKLGTILVDKNEKLDFFTTASITEAKLAYKDSNSFSESDFSIVSPSNIVSNKELNSTFDLTTFPYLDQAKAYFVARYKVSFKTNDFKNAYNAVSGSFRFSFKVGGIFDHA